MGLDMYIYGVNYEYKSKYDGEVEKTTIIETKVQEVYWRKSNQIHRWFVENVQEGVDNCCNYPVSIEELKKLKKDCEYVLNHKDEAEKVLPTQAGFFFGSVEYDEYYWHDIEYTLKEITRLLDECEDLGYDWFEYHSSW